jgi:PII-like signaling protein
MLEHGPAVRVTIHLNDDTGAAGGFLAGTILDFLRRHEIDGATVLRADAGFGAHRQLHKRGAGDVEGLHVPVILYFIEKQQKIDAILDELLQLVTDGLVEAHPTTVLKNATSPEKVIS